MRSDQEIWHPEADMAQIKRLHLAEMTDAGGTSPVHGFVLIHAGGALLVDTGVGGPQQVLDDWRVVNRTVADALADIDMSPADISLVINTHLHFDHCGQNAVFRHAPCYVQRAELARARIESPAMCDWFGFMDASFELLDGDAEIVPGVRVLSTPGHTSGHQSVLVSTDGGSEVLLGDAAYTTREFSGPQDLPDGQASDRGAWDASLVRIKSWGAARYHFCHDTAVLHS
jgi:N-acyl homoserine lactone hydrolase